MTRSLTREGKTCGQSQIDSIALVVRPAICHVSWVVTVEGEALMIRNRLAPSERELVGCRAWCWVYRVRIQGRVGEQGISTLGVGPREQLATPPRRSATVLSPTSLTRERI